jgi:aryl-alcohol dehydrogenase-like predicted oxidoreductase
MASIDRRRFLGTTAGLAATVGGSQLVRGEDQSAIVGEVPPAPPIVPLGKTGIQVSRVAQGTGVHGVNRHSDQSRMGFAKLVALFHQAYDRGITFFDMADNYGTHVYFREALREIPRDRVRILTKLWWRYDGPEMPDAARQPGRADACRAALRRFGQELGTDHIDVLLLHMVTSPTWDHDLEVYRDVLSEAREKGRIGAVGCSCHTLAALKTAAACPWVDVVLARFNLRGVIMDGTPDEVGAVLRIARKNGKAVIGMKILGNGALADQREACIRFAQESSLLDAMTIGFRTPGEIGDMLRLVDRYPAKPLV